jgi:hypothetical protein
MYNLRGQPVQKESEYGLFLVRCPECGTPAAIQEYPVLGRWPGRIRLFVTLGYLFMLLLLLAATCGTFAGFASGTPESATTTLADEINEAWTDYEFAEHQAGRDAMAANGLTPWADSIARDADGRLIRSGYWDVIGPTWWRDTGRYEVLWPMPKRLRLALDIHTSTFVFNVLMAFVFGVTWSVVLIATRRKLLACLGIAPLAFTALFAWLFSGDQITTYGWLDASSAANNAMFWPGMLVTGLIWFVASTLGLIFGRPLARLGVRALLPPGMRGGLAELWFTDNKPLPTGTRAPRTLYPESTGS